MSVDKCSSAPIVLSNTYARYSPRYCFHSGVAHTSSGEAALACHNCMMHCIGRASGIQVTTATLMVPQDTQELIPAPALQWHLPFSCTCRSHCYDDHFHNPIRLEPDLNLTHLCLVMKFLRGRTCPAQPGMPGSAHCYPKHLKLDCQAQTWARVFCEAKLPSLGTAPADAKASLAQLCILRSGRRPVHVGLPALAMLLPTAATGRSAARTPPVTGAVLPIGPPATPPQGFLKSAGTVSGVKYSSFSCFLLTKRTRLAYLRSMGLKASQGPLNNQGASTNRT